MDKVNEIKKEFGNSYMVVYWETDYHRDQGLSEIYERNMTLKDAVRMVSKLGLEYASAEVRVDSVDSELHETAVYYCGPDENEVNHVNEWVA